MTTIIKIRRDTAANWTSANPILASGEPGLETDTLALKYGDGVTEWNDLEYSAVGNAAYADVANIAYNIDVANVANIGNIATVNLDGNSANALRGDGSFGPVDSAGTSINNGLSEVAIESANGNVLININDGSSEWQFQDNNNLIFPGGALVDTSDSNFEFRQFENFNIEANSDINLYTGGGNYQWTFTDTGNLTLPANTFSVNYANGSQVQLGGGGTGFTIEYEVGNFVANTSIRDTGEIQFCTNSGNATTPALADKMFIAAGSSNEQSLGELFLQWSNNSYSGTISLNDSTNQLIMNISDGMIYRTPQEHRGFYAGLNQIWGDDCSVNQLIITNSPTVEYYNTDFTVEDDVFHATNLGTGNIHVMLNVYGSSQYNPINPQNLWDTFTVFVDNVLYDGETLRTDLGDIRTQFYNNAGNFRGNIPTTELFQYFRFTQSSDADYFGTAPTTGGSGTGATVRIRVNPNNTYTVLGTALPGIGYIGGETLLVLGTDLGGLTPANDLTLFIDSVDGDGVITAVSFLSGGGVYPWPSNYISDGSDDQYDTGNYLNTNLAAEISYANGVTQTASAAFGGGDYCVMYNQSFFCMVTTGASIDDLFYSGDLGFDGDGFVRWTGLVNFNAAVDPGNAPEYAYFNCEFLDGDLTIAAGNTYTVTLDSAGINLDGFYTYYDNNLNDYFFGSDNSWRLESQQNLYVQSYNEMVIQTRVNQRGIGETGPSININASSGSPGQKEINEVSGNGGTVYVRGGDAGGADGVNSLGNNGGSVNIDAGAGSGSGTGGTVYIRGGGQDNGTAGDVTISTYSGVVGNGQVNIITNDGTGDRNWAFKADGSTLYPTLTVERGDVSSGTLSGYTLRMGIGDNEAVITTPDGSNAFNSSQRLVINPGKGADGTSGEGGDIYLWAGRGGSGDAGNAISGGSGGDIKIRGGYGGGADGEGGYIRIQGGDSPSTGAAGYVVIEAGETTGGTVGYVSITGGYNSNGDGGNVLLNSGYGSSAYGNVTVTTTPGNTWTFDNNGNLVFPGAGAIITPNFFGTTAFISDNTPINVGTVGANGSAYLSWTNDVANIANSSVASFSLNTIAGPSNATITVGNNASTVYFWNFGSDGNIHAVDSIPSNPGSQQWVGNSSGDGSGYTTLQLRPDNTLVAGDQYIILDPTGPGHIHIRAGGTQDNSNASLYLGGENSHFLLPAGPNPNAVISANNNSWIFDTTGNLTAPGGISAGNVAGNGYAKFTGSFDESEASTPGIFLGYAGNTPRVMFGTGNTSQTFEIDNDGGNLRFYQPGNTKATLTSTGDLSILGNITANNLSNIVVWTTAPVANTSAGTAGQAAYDAGGNLYVCVTTNTWAKFSGTTSW